MGVGHVAGGDLPAVVHSGVEKAIGIQHSAVANYLHRLRRRRPTASPAEIIATLEKQYLAVVTGAGAVLGGAAAVPGSGTGLALTLSAAETALFLETTTFFTLAVAEVHAVRVDDVDDRRELIMTVVLNDGGAMLVQKVAGRPGEHWGKLLSDLVPMSSISALNKTLCHWFLGHWFLTRFPSGHGAFLLSRIVPFGMGAGIGAAGNHAFGRMVVSANRRVFGPPPVTFDRTAATIVDSPQQAVMAPPTPAPSVTPPSGSPAVTEAPVTGKYRPLFEHLAARGTDRIEIGISEIDALVTGGLPKSAATKAWWANSSSSRQAKAWLAADFEVTDVDLGSRTVRFEKRRP